jgi:hypothetical protein
MYGTTALEVMLTQSNLLRCTYCMVENKQQQWRESLFKVTGAQCQYLKALEETAGSEIVSLAAVAAAQSTVSGAQHLCSDVKKCRALTPLLTLPHGLLASSGRQSPSSRVLQ